MNRLINVQAAFEFLGQFCTETSPLEVLILFRVISYNFNSAVSS